MEPVAETKAEARCKGHDSAIIGECCYNETLALVLMLS